MIRLILCKDCKSWKVASNIEMGSCTFKDNEDMSPRYYSLQTTWYDSRCLYGLSEDVEESEIEKESLEV